MAKVKNILFVMADQLRWDHLSCYGHPHLKTPAMDAIAARGVRFERAFVNATVCGPSRMCYYTGRTMSSHGSNWNGVPLRVGEPTLGDHLRPLGMRVALVGKTHMAADIPGLQRLGVPQQSIEGVYARECGFEPYERDDGLHPDQTVDPDLAYNRYLKRLGYNEPNPWHSYANAGADQNGEVLSGWFMRNAQLPARVKEEHSETAYMTDRAMTFIDETGDQPWCMHLSFIKPHWPYIAPAPYHDMFGVKDMLPVNRDERERVDPHPVYGAYMKHNESVSFSRDEVRDAVVPIYMGLIRQIDDHLGRLWRFMEERGLFDNTMIVITSDHGDYLGDHWLGEKELFHEPSVRVPMILYDPDEAADATRGTATASFVEAIDLVPTFVAAAGRAESRPHPGRPLVAGADARRRRRNALARSCRQRTRLFIPRRAAASRSAAGALPRLHDPQQRLEVRAVRGLPAAIVRSECRSARDRRSRRRPGARRGTRGPARQAVRLGA